ncbi:hypothetical protein GW13_PRO4530 [Salmonella enterica subsp. enterica serovar Cerro]|nr:hypothetical protein GW13_PRO4530 [Salmonella enterica subsp. enterica serovar Cerro]
MRAASSICSRLYLPSGISNVIGDRVVKQMHVLRNQRHLIT